MKLTREQVEERKKRAQENLFFWKNSHSAQAEDAIGLVEEEIAIYDLALTALSAEPVAWVHQGWFDLLAAAPGSFQEVIASSIKHGERNIPLFTAPPSLLAENARLREALERFMGTEAIDEKIGWRGSNTPSNAHFSCEFCGESHFDFTLIPHLDDCPILTARAALREPK